MINELNINYYRPSYIKDFIRSTTDSITDTNKIGDLCGSIWGYYNPFDPANIPIRDKPLDPTIYLWHIGKSSAGSNACLSIAPSETLNVEVKINSPTSVPLAMCFYSLTDTDGGLRKDPKVRLAYDATTWDGWNGKFGGWQNSELFYNINPLKYCLMPTISVFDFNTNSVNTSRTLENMAAYINNNAEKRRVCLIRSNLYCGDTAPRSISGMVTPASTIGGLDVGILADRPLCDNLANTVGAWIRDGEGHENYDITKVYDPFNQCLTQLWFDDVNAYQTDVSRQMDIGYYRSATRETFINGRYNVPNSHGKCTAEFCKINYDRKDFADVSYQWRHCTYYGEVGQEIENGFPLLNYGSANSNIKTMSILEILDTKGLTYGEACKRAVLHELAFYGFWIAESVTKAQNDPLGTASTGVGIYLPEKVSGETTGNYFTGDDIADVPYADATDTSPFEYHEDAPPPTSDTLSMFPTEVMALPRFGHTYKCSFNAIDCLNRHLKSFDWSAANREALFFGQNPYDFIINITGYPMVYFPAPYRSYENIVLGKLDLNDPQQLPDLDPDDLYAIGNPIMGGHIIYENPFGSLYVPPYYSNSPYDMAFLDYEPYTTMFLLLPYAGMVSIPPAVFMGKTMNIRMSVDLLSGAVVYFIFANTTYYCTANGNCGTEVPVSGLDYSSYEERYQRTNYMGAAELLTGVNSVIGNATGATVSASFNNTGGMVGQLAMGFLNTMKTGLTTAYTLIEMNRMAPSPVSVSNGNAPLGTAALQDAVLVINRPVLPSSKEFSASSFKKTMGKAANEVGRLGDYSGFTIVKNPILDGISCTAEEKALIIEALNQGVIL